MNKFDTLCESVLFEAQNFNGPNDKEFDGYEDMPVSEEDTSLEKGTPEHKYSIARRKEANAKYKLWKRAMNRMKKTKNFGDSDWNTIKRELKQFFEKEELSRIKQISKNVEVWDSIPGLLRDTGEVKFYEKLETFLNSK